MINQAIQGLSKLILPSMIFLGVFYFHFQAPVITSFDSRWSIHLSYSIIKEHNLDLNEYQRVIAGTDYRVEEVSDRIVSFFPNGTSILATSFVYVIDKALIGAGFDLYEYLQINPPDTVVWQIEHAIASVVVAISAVFVYLLCLQLTEKKILALILVFIYAFSTPIWSVASRGLWSHTFTALLISICLWLLNDLAIGKKQMVKSCLIGALLALAYFVRPTSIIFGLFIAGYYIIKGRNAKQGVVLCIGVGVVVLLFSVIHLITYSELLPSYYAGQRLTLHNNFSIALAGHLVSPQRGLLVYVPWLVLLLPVGIARVIQQRSTVLETLMYLMVGVYWVAIATYPHWWAGHSFGPRFFTELAVVFVLLLAMQLQDLLKGYTTFRKWYLLALTALVGLGLFIHYEGAYDQDVLEWNIEPVDVDLAPERIWDWGDIQFMR